MYRFVYVSIGLMYCSRKKIYLPRRVILQLLSLIRSRIFIYSVYVLSSFVRLGCVQRRMIDKNRIIRSVNWPRRKNVREYLKSGVVLRRIRRFRVVEPIPPDLEGDSRGVFRLNEFNCD